MNEHPELQNISSEQIDDARSGIWHIAWSSHQKITWFVLIAVIFCLIFFAFLIYSTGADPRLLLLPMGLLIGYSAYLYNKAQKLFMQQFAFANNFVYAETGSLDSLHGRLFERGHTRRMTNVLTGLYREHPMRIFYYSYTVGTGDYKTTYNFSVFEVSFEKTLFPHILLQSRTMRRHAAFDSWGDERDTTISIEGVRDKFKLTAARGYEIEALEIFTPDVLEFLSDQGSNFSIEFAKNSMYIYDDLHITRRHELNAMLAAVRNMFDRVGPLLNRLHDDFGALHEYYQGRSKL